MVHGHEVVVTEGSFDWLTAVGWGLPAVALLGTHVSRSAAQALARFRRVHLALGPWAIAAELPAGVHDLNDLGHTPAGREVFQRCSQANRIFGYDGWGAEVVGDQFGNSLYDRRPSFNKQAVLELAQGHYIQARENVVFLGPTGTGEDARLHRSGP